MKFEGIKADKKPRPIRCRLCGKELDEKIYNWDFDAFGAVCKPACMVKFKTGLGA